MKKNPVLSKEDLDYINKLGEVLFDINYRLLKERKIKVENGKVVWLEKTKVNNLPKRI